MCFIYYCMEHDHVTVSFFLFLTYFTYELCSNSCSFSLERPTIMTGSIIYVAIVSFDMYAYTDKAYEPASQTGWG